MSPDVVVGVIKGDYFYVTLRELGEEDCKKGGALSHIIPTCNLIDI